MNGKFKIPNRPKKTDNVIEVVLDTARGILRIMDHEVHGNGIKQTIVWQLEKKLEPGDFTNFEWVDPAAASGTFDPPEISPDGNSLRMSDDNSDGARKNVDHAYVITVEFEGCEYTSRSNSPHTMRHDPIIINR